MEELDEVIYHCRTNWRSSVDRVSEITLQDSQLWTDKLVSKETLKFGHFRPSSFVRKISRLTSLDLARL